MRRHLAFLVPLAAAFAPVLPAQTALLLRDGQPAPIHIAGGDLFAALAKVVRGPDATERARGYTTAIPAGTVLRAVTWDGRRCRPVLSAPFLALVDHDDLLEHAVEQLAKTVFENAPQAVAVDLFVEDAHGTPRALTEFVGAEGPPLVRPDSAPPIAGATTTAVSGALTGRTIVLSPGHGYYWHSTLGWTTQRPLIDGLLEDVHTNEIVMRWLIPALEDLGARVISCRERSEGTLDAVRDDDGGAPAFTTTGTWPVSSSSGYGGGQYHYASSGPGATARATWLVPVPADGRYPVYAWYRSGTNRAPDARYTIEHSGGRDEVRVDQTRDGSTWRHLGDFWFTAAAGARIELDADSTVSGKVVIADAVRLGGGLGSLARGSGTSGRPRWMEAARYWTWFAGAPSSVWDSISGGEDNDDDVTTRPRFAEWLGADAFLSLHTNAGGGLGTSTYIYNGGATAGSATFQSLVHDQVIADVRASYDPTWTDRGKLQANFGEVRVLSTMPGALMELAFHDTPGSVDHQALHDPEFRRIAARAIARGIMRYFAPTAPFAPDAPRAFHVVQDGAGGLRLRWLAAPGATEYSIEQSPDGKGFVEVARATTTTWSTGPLARGTTRSFRVRAWNTSGRSPATEVLTAGTSHRAAELLLVQGFDRLERTVKAPDNTFDYLARHARAIRALGDFSLAFDAASNEAVQLGLCPLTGYRAVDWACGEESTRHETFSTLEQTLVANYLAAGGRLLVSGAEIAWDLDARGSTTDRAFHRNVLGATYVADDAATHGFAPRAGGLFDGVSAGTFDDGSHGTYDVDYPDVLGAADGLSSVDVRYATGTGAGLVRDDGTARVVYLGFPLETIVDDDLRARVMDRALRFVLGPRELEAAPSVALGATTPLALTVPSFAGRTYLLLASFSTEPATVLPGGLVLPLAADGLLFSSLDPTNPLFGGFLGTLDAAGRATATFTAPPLPILSGIGVYFSGVLFAPGGAIVRTLPWVRVTMR